MLVDARFGRLCAPCVPLSRHPAQLANGDPIKLLAALGVVLREVGWLYFAIVLALGAPPILLQLAGVGPVWLWVVVFVVTMSLGESLVFTAWQARVLEQRPHAGIPWRLAFRRLGSATAVNVVGMGAMTLCLPAAILYGCVTAGVALAVLEGRGPIEAFVLAWRRSAGQRVGLSVGAFVTTLPPTILSSLAAGVAVFVSLSPGSRIDLQKALALSTLVLWVSVIPANLFQAVAWLATLPIDEPTTTPPIAEASLTQAPPPS